MDEVLRKVHKAYDSDMEGHAIFCPACRQAHLFPNSWKFNGNLDRPSFTPSMMVYDKGAVCHFFVTDGNIFYLSDSTHSLCGETVELKEW